MKLDKLMDKDEANQDPESMLAGGGNKGTEELVVEDDGKSERRDGNIQEAYDAAVSIGIKLMMGEEGLSKFVGMLKKVKDNPEETIGKLVVMVVTAADQRIKGGIPREIVDQVATELLINAVDLAESRGIIEKTDELVDDAALVVMEGLAKFYGVEGEFKEGMEDFKTSQNQQRNDQRKPTNSILGAL